MKEHDKEKEQENYLTSNQGQRQSHTDDSLKAGDRGPVIMDDHHLREKITHFDHERIPERVVHARGSAAHGYFRVYENMEKYTKAGFLKDHALKTPVFVRFSTVVGFRGSADTVRDVRGFATKFYTEEGNYDLVGNNMPIFFIQDGIKFPDLVHAIKPEPHNEMPQASAAHDNFWDFISLMPESMHMIMWVLSDRALPRSYSMMEGFGVHTFRLINKEGSSHFVKFHWKPLAGMHSLVWDEAQKIAGKEPDFNRRDLYEQIESGNFPEFELCMQIIPEEDEHKFAFDILDATKLWPEELVPLRRVGKMTLDRNPTDFFAETEQVAFHPGHLVSGIDLTNDPLLQGRLFSYVDTQLTRLGGPNFAEIPINRPHAPVNNNQRDGFMRQHVSKSKVNYFPNSRGDGNPKMAPENEGGFVHYPQQVSGQKIRSRSEGFRDFYSQATLFWKSMTDIEQKHIVEAAWFELGKVEDMDIRNRMLRQFAHVDGDLSHRVAEGIGIDPLPQQDITEIQMELKSFRDRVWKDRITAEESPALSMEKNSNKENIQGRKVAILADQGADTSAVQEIKEWLMEQGAKGELVSSKLGMIKGDVEIKIDKTFATAASVVYDAVFLPSGSESIKKLRRNGNAIHFINEAYKHCKAIGVLGEAKHLLPIKNLHDTSSDGIIENWDENGVVFATALADGFKEDYYRAIAQHRHWDRTSRDEVPA